MKKASILIAGTLVALGIGFSPTLLLAQEVNHTNMETKTNQHNPMKLGAFSVSLSVKDLQISKAFYEKLGFQVFGGSMEQNYLIMKNGNALIGLF